ncbi:hypothetical protein SLEP1_g51845 [Rubroshorea leprosula]|uniref:Uncharacterized protein n=1 Tax=Rubroshorea leprosula TaxID=152421 RepID=A0AAV5M638_9ROSI|nr:hypothetical protein SLEP1_g51845 [Rubroshorea leprosula]
MDAGRTFDGCATGSFVSFELFAGIVYTNIFENFIYRT